MRNSPLPFLTAGATLVEVDGVAVPAHFGDPREEALLARRQVAICDRSQRTRIGVVGRDAISFLQGQTTNDVAALKPLEGCYAAVLNGKGRMRGDLRVCRRPEGLLVETEGSLRSALVEHLQRFVIMEDVSFEDRSETLAALAVVGPRAAELLQTITGVELPKLKQAHAVACGELLLLGEPTTGAEGYLATGDPDSVSRLGRQLLEAGAGLMGEQAWEALRVEAGVARWGFDMDEKTFPQEAQLTRAISYTKGCYTGQETMARLKNYGQVNRQLIGLVFEDDLGPPERGTSLLDGEKQVGAITSAAVSPMLERPIALAMVRREAAEQGRLLQLEESAALRPASVVSLPLWKER